MGTDTPQVTPVIPIPQPQIQRMAPTKKVEELYPQGNALLVKLTMATISTIEGSGIPPAMPQSTIQQARPTPSDQAIASGTVLNMGPLVRKTTWPSEGTIFFDLAAARKFTWDGILLAIVSEDAVYASRTIKEVPQRYQSLSETLAAKK
jgi:hypothetical protein